MTEIRIVLANRDAIVISIDDNPYIYTETSGEWYDIQLRLPATFSKKLNWYWYTTRNTDIGTTVI